MVNIVAGDETGLLKLIDSETGVVKSYGQQSRKQKVIAVVPSYNHSEIVSIRGDSTVEVWRHDADSQTLELCSSVSSQIVDPVCASTIMDGTFVINCNGEGAIIKMKSGMDDTNSNDVEFVDLHGPITACTSNPNMHNRIALGGKERDLYLYDYERGDISWEAKNVPHDNLNLRVPIWITAVEILDENTIVTGTAYKHIRLYDIRANQRPVKSFNLDGDYRVAALRSIDSDILVGDTAGNQYMFDLGTFRQLRTFKGATGSIRAFDTHNDFIISGGLDRHVRVYRKNSGTALHTVYIKNRVTSVLCITGDSNEESSQEESEGTDDLIESLDQDDGDEDE